MKKQFATILTAVVVMAGATAYIATPVQPERYELHIVTYGETLESIIQDSNKDNTNYDVREATATAVAESKKMEGGANSYLIHPGDKVAVPIYK